MPHAEMPNRGSAPSCWSLTSSSPYLITVNPKLNGLGQLDASLFGDLNQLLGKQPGSAPQESRQQYTDVNTFLGDAAFDTRYVSNTVLNQTGSRYPKLSIW
ncbi:MULTISPECIES: hypothetical protein [unclassified Enterobacter]|jgi:filamentous hemagglutinin|uniref:hypothetical protein n=1 Tax=unclassified Enterobacter TaxID=2608935 RepID=UPI0015C8F849|nr:MULTISPECIES: hypothetical protein [unclassified Enterobacter]MBB3306749.1 hypothetical protein [Enterobacter sp. Sphag1F]NYI15926.1 hypothetical protein [Enterobacter sp. Sphag71]